MLLWFALAASIMLCLILSQAEDRGSRLRAFLFSLLGVLFLSPLLWFVMVTSR